MVNEKLSFLSLLRDIKEVYCEKKNLRKLESDKHATC